MNEEKNQLQKPVATTTGTGTNYICTKYEQWQRVNRNKWSGWLSEWAGIKQKMGESHKTSVDIKNRKLKSAYKKWIRIRRAVKEKTTTTTNWHNKFTFFRYDLYIMHAHMACEQKMDEWR